MKTLDMLSYVESFCMQLDSFLEVRSKVVNSITDPLKLSKYKEETEDIKKLFEASCLFKRSLGDNIRSGLKRKHELQ